jgi:hypothetical protein
MSEEYEFEEPEESDAQEEVATDVETADESRDSLEQDDYEGVGDEGEDETSEPGIDQSDDSHPGGAKSAPQWVKELRQDHRALKREKKELEKRILELSGAGNQQAQSAQEKPTIEGFDYDSDAYETALEKWILNKIEIESKKEEESSQWKASLDNYSKLKKSIDPDEFSESEENVKIELSVTQQGIILQWATNSALVVYKLGKNEKLLSEFSKIKDPIKFALAISNYEKGMGNSMEKEKPKPERVIKPGQHSSSNNSRVESKLLEKARETGNFSELFAFRKKQKQ